MITPIKPNFQLQTPPARPSFGMKLTIDESFCIKFKKEVEEICKGHVVEGDKKAGVLSYYWSNKEGFKIKEFCADLKKYFEMATKKREGEVKLYKKDDSRTLKSSLGVFEKDTGEVLLTDTLNDFHLLKTAESANVPNFEEIEFMIRHMQKSN